jgi:hypothetical protein
VSVAAGIKRLATSVRRLEAARSPLAALDPVMLARAAGIDPDPWQVRLLQSTAPRILLNCSRQSGKSTTTAVLATHTALYRPRSLVLLLSRAERQSEELFRKCMDVYRALGKPVRAESERVLGLELGNGSRIIALPGKEDTVRSFSGVALLAVDEASRVPDPLYYSIRPMLAVSGGRLVVLSTPFGKRGFFHKEWTEGEGWERFEVPATMCPRISPAFLAEERRTLPPWWYQQEYDCRFGETVDQLFSYEDVAASLSDEVLPLFAS